MNVAKSKYKITILYLASSVNIIIRTVVAKLMVFRPSLITNIVKPSFKDLLDDDFGES